MIKISEHLLDKRAETVQPQEEKIQEGLTGVYKLPVGGDVKKTEPVYTSQQCPRKRGNGHKKKYKKFHLNVRKTLFFHFQ